MNRSGPSVDEVLARLLQLPITLTLIQVDAFITTFRRFTEAILQSVTAPASPVSLPAPMSIAPREPPVLRLLESRQPGFDEQLEGLPGDSLKLVRSRIVFVKRGGEFAFESQETLVADDLAPGVFEAWKIAEFVQKMADPERAPEIPPDWLTTLPLACRHSNGRLRRFPPGDLKYLRVFFEVVRYSPRESLHFHERQLRLLSEISAKLDQHRDV